MIIYEISIEDCHVAKVVQLQQLSGDDKCCHALLKNVYDSSNTGQEGLQCHGSDDIN